MITFSLTLQELEQIKEAFESLVGEGLVDETPLYIRVCQAINDLKAKIS